MSVSQAASAVEKVIGHDDSAVTAQDVSTYDGQGSSETMKALCWMGKNSVQVLDVARPKILEPSDVILKVTGSTVCGSDLHLLHGECIDLPYDILLTIIAFSVFSYQWPSIRCSNTSP